MSLQTIRDALQALSNQGKLTLSSVVEEVPPLSSVLSSLPPIADVPLSASSFDLSGSGLNQALTIKSTLDWGLLKSVPITVTVTPDPSADGKYVSTLEVDAPASAQVSIPFVTWFQFADFKIVGSSLQFVESASALSGGIRLALQTTLVIQGDKSQTPIPIQIASDPTGVLLLTLNTSSIELPSINSILAAFGDTSGINLPSTLNDLLHFSLLDLSVGFDPSTPPRLTSIGVEIGNSAQSTDGWQIIPGTLSLVSYNIGLNILDPSGTRQIGGLIAAKTKLGSVDIDVAALHPPSGGWNFQGIIGKENPVPIGELISGLGHQFGVTLPAALNDFTLSDFEFEFNTQTAAASGQFTVNFTINQAIVELTVTAALQKSGSSYQANVAGKLIIGTSQFDVSFTSDTSKVIQASWSDTENPVQFGNIASKFGWTDMPPVPENLDLALTSVKLYYDLDKSTLAVSGTSLHYGQILFASLAPSQGPRLYLVELDVPLNVHLADLPVIGDKLPSGDQYGIDNLQMIVTSGDIDAANMQSLNALITANLGDSPLIPTSLQKGITFAARLDVGSDKKAFILPLTSGGTAKSSISSSMVGGAQPPASAGIAALAMSASAGSQALDRKTLSSSGAEKSSTSSFSVGGAQLPPARTDITAVTAPSSSGSQAAGQSLTIGKSFGPATLQSIGALYQTDEKTLWLQVDASLAFGPLSVSLAGLGLGSPLKTFSPQFNLQGLMLNFQRGNLDISGAFLKVIQDGVTSYYGEVVVQTANLGLTALGGYTPAYGSNPASFFLYANLNAPLGGPPFLFITGFAGGFGFNRTLVLPTLDELPTYILLPANAPAPGATPSDTITAVLPQLEKVFLDAPNEYWLAAGIQFTSFEMIQAFAVLTVAFGVDLEIAVLGTCAMTLPTGDPYPIAYIEIVMMASFSSSSGLLAVQGKLAPSSYLYGGFCKLQGGFAFYTWFTGDHAGDFVVAIGGYNPAYTPPAYYPKVPRLGMAFGLGPFQVTGQAYFALTPAMMMAGLTLSATWSSGPISAWLDTGVDFLLAWAPLYYQANAYVSIGCSVDLGLFTLNAHVGAALTIWGPSFGGRATVDLDVVSFTIAFGSNAPTVTPLGWNQFKSNFLPQDSTPAPKPRQMKRARNLPRPLRELAIDGSLDAPPDTAKSNIIKASVPSGLISTDVMGDNGVNYNWIVDPNQFVILTNSTIPANYAEWTLSSGVDAIPNTVSSYNPQSVDVTNGPYLSLPPGTSTFSDTQVWNPDVNIGPMDQSNVQSFHTITLKMHADSDPAGVYSLVVTSVAAQPVMLHSNAALWAANKPEKTVDDPALVPFALVGLQLSPIQRDPDQVSDVPLLTLLFGQGFSTGFSYTAAAVNPDFTVTFSIDPDSKDLTIQISGPGTNERQILNQGYVLGGLNDAWVVSQRNSILADLSNNGFSTYTEVNLGVLATETALVDWPQVALLGDI